MGVNLLAINNRTEQNVINRNNFEKNKNPNNNNNNYNNKRTSTMLEQL